MTDLFSLFGLSACRLAEYVESVTSRSCGTVTHTLQIHYAGRVAPLERLSGPRPSAWRSNSSLNYRSERSWASLVLTIMHPTLENGV